MLIQWYTDTAYRFNLISFHRIPQFKRIFSIEKSCFVNLNFIFFNIFIYIACTSNPCLHGKCFHSDMEFICSCDHGYTGQYCDTGNASCLKTFVFYSRFQIDSLISGIQQNTTLSEQFQSPIEISQKEEKSVSIAQMQ